MAKKKTPTTRKTSRVAARPASAPRLDLSNPKDRAVLDVLALAMSADSLVTADELSMAVEQMGHLLKLDKSNPDLAEQLRGLVSSSVAACHKDGHDRVLQRAIAAMETPEERRMLFALATSITCADGVIEEPEARFLARLRAGLGLSEDEAMRGVAGVASVVARAAR